MEACGLVMGLAAVGCLPVTTMRKLESFLKTVF